MKLGIFWVTPSHKAAEQTLIKKTLPGAWHSKVVIEPKTTTSIPSEMKQSRGLGFSTLLLVLLGRRWHQGSHLPRATHSMRGKVSIYTQGPFASEFSRGGPRNLGDTCLRVQMEYLFKKNLNCGKVYTIQNVSSLLFFLAKACRIWVPWPGIEPAAPEWRAWDLNHWATREVPLHYF